MVVGGVVGSPPDVDNNFHSTILDVKVKGEIVTQEDLMVIVVMCRVPWIIIHMDVDEDYLASIIDFIMEISLVSWIRKNKIETIDLVVNEPVKVGV